MNKIESVEVFRVLAIVFVLILHTNPFKEPLIPLGSMLDLAMLMSQLARFAVPLFFIFSGYFWSQKISGNYDIFLITRKMIKRISFIFIAWSLVYILPTNIVDSFDYGALGPIKRIYWNLRDVLQNPLITVFQGTKLHLWFLVSLIFNLLISSVFVRYKLKKQLIFVAVILFLIGILGKAYSGTPLGFYTDFNLRNGPFFSLIFFVTGYFLQQCKKSSKWLIGGLAISIIGLLLQFTELQVINKFYGTSMWQDYVIGTYFYGLGIALIALSNNKKFCFRMVKPLAPLVLGIYVSHVVIIDLLTPINRYFVNNAIWDISYLVLVFTLSSALTLLLMKFKITKRLVT